MFNGSQLLARGARLKARGSWPYVAWVPEFSISAEQASYWKNLSQATDCFINVDKHLAYPSLKEARKHK